MGIDPTPLWACLALACSASLALAQTPQEIQPFQLTDISGAVFTETQYRADEDTLSGARITERDLMVTTGLDLVGRGYLYHPNLVDFVVGGTFSWNHEDIERQGESESSDGELLGYNVGATILRAKPVSLRLFADRSQRVLNRSFAQRTELERENLGGELFIRGPLTVAILAQTTESHETAQTRLDDQEILYTRLRITDVRDTDFYNELTYEREEIEQEIRSRSADGSLGPAEDLSRDRDEMNYFNRWAFRVADAPAPKSTLIGQVNVRQQTGAFEQQTLLIQQALDLAHSDSFSTFYNGRFRTLETEGNEDREVGGQVGLRKRFYQSLDVTLHASARDQEYEGGQESQHGVGMDLDYRKRTPVGYYTSSLGVQRSWHREESDAGNLRVIDEAVTLSGLTGSTLSRANVVSSSIVVTNLAQVPYTRGVDYQVRRFGSLTEIARLAGGLIADGETVLVDYDFSTARDARFTADQFTWRHRLALEDAPLALYVEYRNYIENLTAGEDPGGLDRSESILLGLELLLGDLTLRGEHEKRSERLNLSADINRFRAEFFRQLDRDITLSLSGGYEMIQYRDAQRFGLGDDEDHLDTVSASAGLATRLNRHTLARLDASFHQSRGRVNNMQARLGGELAWRKGQLSITVNGYHARYEQEDNEGVTDFLGVKVRRAF